MITLVVPTGELKERLAPHLPETLIHVWRPDGDEVFPGAADLLVLPYMMPARDLERLRGLPITVVQSQTLGYDGVADHLPGGMSYCNAIDVHEGSTAELALGLTLAALRGIPEAVRNADRGVWDHRRTPGLAGKRVLLVGVGGVGKEIIRRIEPFGAEVDLVARTPREGVHDLDELPALLPGADVVIIAIPLHDETRRFVDARFLAAMKHGALLVSVSRGEIVDTDALLAELTTGRVRAALDVTDPEPLPPGHPLWNAPGVLITPHIGGDTDAMDDRVDRVIFEQVHRLLRGEAPQNLVYDAAR